MSSLNSAGGARDRHIGRLVVSFAVLVATATSCGTASEVAPTIADLACTDHPHRFSSVAAVRALGSDAALVLDALEQRVHRIEFAANTAIVVGSIGDGPSEYRIPAALLALAADSTAIFDIANQRIAVVDDRGTISYSSPLRLQGLRITAAVAVGLVPRASDDRGRLYFESPRLGATGELAANADSTLIIRWDRNTDRIDTVARIASAQSFARVVDEGTRRNISIGMVSPWQAAEAWAVMHDGRVAVVTPHPYRVRYYSDGRVITGDSVVTPTVRLTASHLSDLLALREANAIRIRVQSNESSARGPDDSSAIVGTIGEPLPPFGSGAVVAVGGREVWVQRFTPDGLRNPVFDVFDSVGQRTRRIALERDARLVHATNRALYFVRTDPDDLQIVRRCVERVTAP